MPDGVDVGHPDDAWRALLITGSRYGGVAGSLTAIGCLPWGVLATRGAVLGTVLGVAAFTVGPLLLRAASAWSPPAVMAAALAGYLAIVLLLGGVYAVLERVSGLAQLQVGLALLAVALGESVGQMRAVARLRILAFGAGGDAERAPEIPGQRGKPGDPYTPRDW